MLINFIIPLIFQGIFEGIVLTFNSVIFLKTELEWKKILLIASICGSAVYIIRLVPMTFGLHVILGFIILSILLKNIYKKPLLECFMSVIKSIILLSIFEIICISLIVYISGIKQEEIMATPILKTLVLQPHILLMFLTGNLILKYRKINKEEREYLEL